MAWDNAARPPMLCLAAAVCYLVAKLVRACAVVRRGVRESLVCSGYQNWLALGQLA